MSGGSAARSRSLLYPAQELRRRAQAWAVKLRVNPRVIRVQEMRRKWGSCSQGGTVTLAASLLNEPRQFQDYVIVHELLHLRVGRHGRLFKALMSTHLPGWQRQQAATVLSQSAYVPQYVAKAGPGHGR